MKLELNNSQQRVFDYIVENGSITSLEAIQALGETRISARIFELRDKGVPIDSKYIKVENRHGESRHVKKYFFG